MVKSNFNTTNKGGKMKQEVKDKIEEVSTKHCTSIVLNGVLTDSVKYLSFKIGAEFGYNLAQEEYASKGMRWVKASERLPNFQGLYKVKTTYGSSVEKREFTGSVFTNYSGYAVIEWLDESTQEGGTVEGEPVNYQNRVAVGHMMYQFMERWAQGDSPEILTPKP